MLGKYLLSSDIGELLYDIKKSDNVLDILLESMNMGMKIKPSKIIVNDDLIQLELTNPMMPEQKTSMKLTWKESYYEVDGELPYLGKAAGKALLFTGKTKFELMLEELPKVRTGKVVARTDKEIEAAVEELLNQMTLEEKIGQMSQSGGANTTAIGGAVKTVMTDDERIKAGYLGSMIVMAPQEIAFEKQRLAVEQSRLGIPLLFCQDVIHGYQTIFPIPLGWSCSFNPALLQKAMAAAASETTTQGIKMGFSPMLDIARDPRWGRVSEGNGEDPYLCSKMCEAHVKGFQGENLSASDSLLACLKHYVGYSAAEAGRDYNTAEITNTSLHNTYLPPFQAGINAGAASIMNSFNVMDSVPVVINKKVCRDILRGEMGFEGVLISDYNALSEAIIHGAAEDEKDAAIKGLLASLDIEMVSTNYITTLTESVREGLVSEELINEAARRILRCKYKAGLMDDPYRYFQPEKNDLLFCEEHLEISYELARESIVLLKNNGVLPLTPVKKLALIGPKADSTDLLGPWQFSKYKDETVTLKQGLEAAGVQLIYEPGCDIAGAIEGGITRAVTAAKESDVIVLALGEPMYMSGEAASLQSIALPQAQLDLAFELKKLGKPIILVLTNGRPLLLDWFEENADAIVETWFLGSQAGRAIADVLLGLYNPSGKLSISFPRTQGQIPIYYNHLRTGRPYTQGNPNKFLSKYLDGPNTPLYTFGYGLSYTSFEIKELKLSSAQMKPDGDLRVSVLLKNTGAVEGTETLQLYIHDVAAQIARPVKELKGFRKVTLAPGAMEEVSFVITKEELSYYNQESLKVVDPGKFEVYVGTSSRNEDLLKSEFILVE